MTQIVSSLEEVHDSLEIEPFPLLLIPDGQGDETHMLWVVTNGAELGSVFADVQEASYTGKVIVTSRHGAGSYWQSFRTPKDNHPVPKARCTL